MAASSLDSICRKQPWKDAPDREENVRYGGPKAAATVAKVEEFARANGQILLPFVELVTQAGMAVDEMIDTIGRETIESIGILVSNK